MVDAITVKTTVIDAQVVLIVQSAIGGLILITEIAFNALIDAPNVTQLDV